MAALTSTACADEPVLVRVGLAFGVPAARISCSSGFELLRPNGQAAGHLAAEVVAKPSADGVELNALDYAGHAWILRGIDPSAPIDVNGHQYRGDMTVVHDDAGGIDVVNYVDLDSYIAGVLAGEVPASWPEETLKAQAVAARSYAMHRLQHHAQNDWDVVATDKDQVYDGIHGEVPSIIRAVEDTRGQVLSYQGQIIKAYFSADCGGHTESSATAFGEPAPYLQGVPDPYCGQSPYQQWERDFTINQVRQLLAESGKRMGTVLAVKPKTRDQSGRVVDFEFSTTNGDVVVPGIDLRRMLGYRDLRSTLFDVAVKKTALTTISVGKPTIVTQTHTTDTYVNEDVTVGFDETKPTEKTVESFYVMSAGGILDKNRAGYAYAATGQGILRTFAMRPGLDAVGLEHTVDVTRFSTPTKVTKVVTKQVTVPAPTEEAVVPVLLRFVGRGWGHGVGLCQWGARGMATQGFTYKQILAHYYPGTSIVQAGH
jgi:stage II sporulation protein D